MQQTLEEIFPIMDVDRDCVISKMGDVTVAFELELPEIFTSSSAEFETIHQSWIKSLKVLPKHTMVHKQDWFMESKYNARRPTENQSFLSKSSERHFDGRPFWSHSCYVFLSKKPEGRSQVSSASSSLFRKSLVPDEVLNPRLLQEFLDAAGQFAGILKSSGFIKVKRLKNHQLGSSKTTHGLIERYCYLLDSETNGVIRDISFKDGLKIGELHCQLYSIADAIDLPAMCGPRINFDKYSTDRTKFSIGFASPLGLLLPCNHIFNQYILIDDAPATLKKLESKRLRLQSLSAYSRENAIARDAVNDFLNESISEQRMPVKAHFNVLAFSEDKGKMNEIRNLVSTALAQMEVMPKEETVGAAQIWWAGIPGNAAELPINEMFDSFIEQATCFLNVETNYRSDPPEQGIRFCDRLSGRPVYVDMFDAVRAAGITSNMGLLCCGTSGGGKSMTICHLLRSLYDQGAHCVIIDIGGSYKGLCELVGGFYFTYEEKNPIKFNPFYIAPGEVLDTEKKESLKALLIALWKQENESFNRSEYVALSNALQGYYSLLEQDKNLFPCFNTFYEYLETKYVEVLKGHNIKDSDFDIYNFLYVLRPYYRNGEFDYLLNATENLDLLNQQFIVVELDNIKNHPILFAVVTLSVMEMFISKIRKLHGTRKVLIIDEAWKAITKAGMAEFLQYAYKTIRKFNGIPGVVTQELDDLISSPIVKDAIINNADIKILMDMRKFVNKFDKLQDVLGLSEKAKTILLSVNKDDREIFIDLGGQITKVYRNELCPEEYFAFTTEGKERVKVAEYSRKYGGMEKGIEMLAKELREQKNKL